MVMFWESSLNVFPLLMLRLLPAFYDASWPPPAETWCTNIISFVIKVPQECCIDWYTANVLPRLLSGEEALDSLSVELHMALSEVRVSVIIKTFR